MPENLRARVSMTLVFLGTVSCPRKPEAETRGDASIHQFQPRLRVAGRSAYSVNGLHTCGSHRHKLAVAKVIFPIAPANAVAPKADQPNKKSYCVPYRDQP